MRDFYNSEGQGHFPEEPAPDPTERQRKRVAYGGIRGALDIPMGVALYLYLDTLWQFAGFLGLWWLTNFMVMCLNDARKRDGL